MPEQIPIVNYLVINDDQAPHLLAQECTACGARFLARRVACARCGQRVFSERILADTGTVGSFTIIHRAGKGIATPFVSALVDLVDGTTVKANIVGCDPSPDAVHLNMPVRLTTFPAGTDESGTVAVAFGFEPIAGTPTIAPEASR